jgi:NAD(P)-dependent dehydrogenase (short-subunit alcohol dehydrogenase family)
MTDSSTIGFDASAPADLVAADCDLRGRLAVVTGASAGIGQETARVLAKAGADVFLGARRPDALDEVARTITREGAQGKLHRGSLDLSEPESIDRFVDAVLALGRPVDILVNNAGVMACPLARDARGNEMQLSTNFLGHALLTSRLAPALRQSGSGRLVSLTSVAHHRASVDLEDLNFERRPYDPWVAYGQSKTACALLAVKAQSALAASGVDAFAVHPGVIPATELQKHLSAEDLARAVARSKISAATYKTIATGAATSVWAATSEDLKGRGPLYLEDCRVARVIDASTGTDGVCGYAMDPTLADQLWSAAERLLGRALPL